MQELLHIHIDKIRVDAAQMPMNIKKIKAARKAMVTSRFEEDLAEIKDRVKDLKNDVLRVQTSLEDLESRL
jgi:t-SNARE complex subunit (syntaxin)